MNPTGPTMGVPGAESGDGSGAEQEITAFLQRFPARVRPAYRRLLYYAAMPLVVTPELLHYLRVTLVRDAPWVAEVDTLLAPGIFEEKNFEQYIMRTHVRAWLVRAGDANLEASARRDAAWLLVRYLHNEEASGAIGEYERSTQTWAALLYLDDHRDAVVREIKAAMQQALLATQDGGSAQGHQMLQAMLETVQQLAPVLAKEPALLEFAREMQAHLHDLARPGARPSSRLLDLASAAGVRVEGLASAGPGIPHSEAAQQVTYRVSVAPMGELVVGRTSSLAVVVEEAAPTEISTETPLAAASAAEFTIDLSAPSPPVLALHLNTAHDFFTGLLDSKSMTLSHPMSPRTLQWALTTQQAGTARIVLDGIVEGVMMVSLAIEVHVAEQQSQLDLSAEQIRRLNSALSRRYARRDLQRLVRQTFDLELEAITSGSSGYSAQVRSLIRWAQRNDEVPTLVHAAYADHPDDQDLMDLEDALGSSGGEDASAKVVHATSQGTAESKIVILVLAANPLGPTPLHEDEEFREIAGAIQDMEQGNRFSLHTYWQVRSEEFAGILLRYRPQIIHFVGQGERGGIYLRGQAQRSAPLLGEQLTQLLATGPRVECVVLSSCYTDDLGRALSRLVPFVIGTQPAISDRGSAIFITRFYRALAYGQTYGDAYRSAVNAAQKEGAPNEDLSLIILRQRDDKEEQPEQPAAPQIPQIKTLTSEQFRALQSALLSAFTLKDLTQLLWQEMGAAIEQVAGTGNLTSTVFNVLDWAQRTGQLNELIEAAVKYKPDNAELQAFVAALRPPSLPRSKRLNGTQIKRFMDALLSAYSAQGLEQLMYVAFDVRLAEIVDPASPLTEICFDIITWAERNAQLDELIEAALANQPTNPELQAFAASLRQPSDQESPQASRPRITNLTVAQRDHLKEALASAYSRQELERSMFIEMGINLNTVVAPEMPLAETCFAVIEWAERTGRLEELIRVALQERPDSPQLQAFLAALDQSL